MLNIGEEFLVSHPFFDCLEKMNVKNKISRDKCFIKLSDGYRFTMVANGEGDYSVLSQELLPYVLVHCIDSWDEINTSKGNDIFQLVICDNNDTIKNVMEVETPNNMKNMLAEVKLAANIAFNTIKCNLDENCTFVETNQEINIFLEDIKNPVGYFNKENNKGSIFGGQEELNDFNVLKFVLGLSLANYQKGQEVV